MNENALCNADYFQGVVFHMIWNSVLLVGVLFYFFSMFVAKPVFTFTCLIWTVESLKSYLMNRGVPVSGKGNRKCQLIQNVLAAHLSNLPEKTLGGGEK